MSTKPNKKKAAALRRKAIAKLELATVDTDREAAHVNADAVLCDLLHALGYSDVVEVYRRVDKWYA